MPARNEAEFIAASVVSLLKQGVEVFLVDDHSTDSTSAIARAAAAEAGKADALKVIAAEPLPAGWSGKLWALKQGVAHALDPALETSPDFLLLTDADIVHGPETVATLTALADSGGYDLVSFMVKLHCRSFPEKLLIPAFVFFFFLLYPPAWIRDSRRSSRRGSGRMHVDSSAGAGARRRPGGDTSRDHRRLRFGARGEAQRRTGLALADGWQRERAALRVLDRHRADDFANGFQPVAPLRRTVAGDLVRSRRHLPVAPVAAVGAKHGAAQCWERWLAG